MDRDAKRFWHEIYKLKQC